jgi:HAD superfamily hydrolase (TIGR01509 family)
MRGMLEDDELEREEAEKRLDAVELRPGMEPLTPEEKERFLAHVRAQGRSLTSEEQYALFGPPPEPMEKTPTYHDVAPMEAAELEETDLAQLARDFFPELDVPAERQSLRLVQGVIFDFDHTLARLAEPMQTLLERGAQAAEAYMRSTGMDLPPDFASNIVEARRFAEEKSAEEKEEHLADDALSFLLQFYGYPASRMDPQVLKQAVDLFYAPEMTAWRLAAGARDALEALRADGCKLALLSNYNCDRVFQRAIDYLRLRPYFDVCLCSAAVEYRKPDPRFFQIVLDRWDALPYEVVVIGDSLIDDVQGGLELGALAVWMDGPTSSQIEQQNQLAAYQVKPDAVVHNLEEVPALIRQWY